MANSDDVIADSGHESSLICLFDELSESTSLALDPNHGQLKSIQQKQMCPTVSSPWQCLIEGKWIVGVKVYNSTTQPLHGLALSLVARQNSRYPVILQSESNWLPTSTEPTNLETIFEESLLTNVKSISPKPSEVELLPNDYAYVVAATTVPVFNQPSLSCNLVLQWKENTVDVAKSVACRIICVGNASLQATDVASGNMQLNVQKQEGCLTKQDELSLNAVQLETILDVSARHSNISHMASMIQHSLNFLSMKSHLICATGALSLCRIYVTNNTATNVQLRVFTCDEKRLLLFIHSLYNLVPDDVIITPIPSLEKVNSAIANAFVKLDEELTGRVATYHNLILADWKTSVESLDVGEQETKSVADWRKEFAMQQTSSRNQQPSTVKLDGCVAKTMKRTDLQMQLATDTAFMELARTAGLGK